MQPPRHNIVAFVGGVNIYEVGPIEDIVCFFNLTLTLTSNTLDEHESSIIHDRLFKRYLTIAETKRAVEVMNKINEIFSTILVSDVSQLRRDLSETKTSFKLDGPTLSDAAECVFKGFGSCARSAIFQYEHGFFRPVKLSRSDFGSLHETDERPLAEYDNLDGPPFWLDPRPTPR